MKQKKAFTLLEILLVIIILGILTYAFFSLKWSVDRDFVKAQTCGNQIIALVERAQAEALTQK